MLEERLRNHIDSIADPVTLDELTARGGHDAPLAPEMLSDDASAVAIPEFDIPAAERSGNRTLALVAASIVAVLLGGLLFANLRTDEQGVVAADSTDDSASPVASLPTLPEELSTAEWREVTDAFTPLHPGAIVQVEAVVASGGEAWAVGGEFLTAGEQAVDVSANAAIWRSDDGETWTPVDLGFGPVPRPIEDEPDIAIFEHVVTTDDGAIWAFGVSSTSDESARGFVVRPLAYRSTNGNDWQRLELPRSEFEESWVQSASVDGNTVLAVLHEETRASDNFRTGLTTTDGETWTTLLEQHALESGSQAILHDGEVVSVRDIELPGETASAFDLVAGSDGFVVSGLENSVDAIEEGERATQRAGLWHSVDGTRWTPYPRPDSFVRSFETEPFLFAHDAGVLAAIEWHEGDERGIDLWNLYERGTVIGFGELPPAEFEDMFVLGGRAFFVGTAATASQGPSFSSSSVWVADTSNDSSTNNSATLEDFAIVDPIGSFELCLDAVERMPEAPRLDVAVDADGRLVVETEFGAPEDRVQLCQDTVNREIDARTTGSATFTDPLPRSPEQSAALSAGVSEEEFDQAWELFGQCSERGGNTVTQDEFGYSWEGQSIINTACYSWHVQWLASIWNLSQEVVENPSGEQRLRDDIEREAAWVAIEAEELGLTELLEEADPQRCDTAYGDRSAITTFDDMAQPFCVIVGEEHDLDFWNKGFETATVRWPGGDRVLTSDSSFATGRIGDVLPAGTHEIVVEPYGTVTLHVIPQRLSVVGRLAATFEFGLSRVPGVEGLSGTVFADALGADLETVPPQNAINGCWHARVTGDPYSPTFLMFGDGLLDSSVYAGIDNLDDPSFIC